MVEWIGDEQWIGRVDPDEQVLGGRKEEGREPAPESTSVAPPDAPERTSPSTTPRDEKWTEQRRRVGSRGPLEHVAWWESRAG